MHAKQRKAIQSTHSVSVLCDGADNLPELRPHVQLVGVEHEEDQVRPVSEPLHHLSVAKSNRIVASNRCTESSHRARNSGKLRERDGAAGVGFRRSCPSVHGFCCRFDGVCSCGALASPIGYRTQKLLRRCECRGHSGKNSKSGERGVARRNTTQPSGDARSQPGGLVISRIGTSVGGISCTLGCLLVGMIQVHPFVVFPHICRVLFRESTTHVPTSGNA